MPLWPLAVMFLVLLVAWGSAFATDSITLSNVSGRAIVIHHPRFYMCDDYQIIHVGAVSPAAHPTWEPDSTHLTCRVSDPAFELVIPNCKPKIVTVSPGQRTLSCI
jgi:hypothetical protein